MAILLQDWNQQQISFTSGETAIARYRIPNGYVNATEMCQANGKRWGNYKQLKYTNEYWQELEADTGIPVSELVIQITGDDEAGKQGTWVHPEIAVDLGAWISPKFRLWVNRQIKNIMKTGKVELQQEPKSHLEVLVEMAQALVEQDKRVKALEANQIEQAERIETLELETIANSAELERFKNGHGRWFSIVGYANLKGLSFNLQQASQLGRKASALCRLKNIKPESVFDPRFGTVKCYPDYILGEII